MTVKSSVLSSDVEELFIQRKQLKWEDFSSSIDRVNYLASEIERAYVPSVGIQAADLCRILYAYFPARKVYEGIAYQRQPQCQGLHPYRPRPGGGGAQGTGHRQA